MPITRIVCVLQTGAASAEADPPLPLSDGGIKPKSGGRVYLCMGGREFWLNVVLPWQERRRANSIDAASASAVPQPVKRRSMRG